MEVAFLNQEQDHDHPTCYIGQAKAQEDCASTFADHFVDVGDIDNYKDAVDWSPGDNAHPDAGWPWFRNIDLNVNSFHIDDTIDTESMCGGLKGFDSILEGALTPLNLMIDGLAGQGESTALSGRFSLAMDECPAGGCRAELQALELDVPNFQVGPVELSGLSIRLAQPASGRIDGSQLRIPGHELALVLEGRAQAISELSVAGLDLGRYLDGRHQRLIIRASGDFVGQLDAGELAITELKIDAWPVTAQLTTAKR